MNDDKVHPIGHGIVVKGADAGDYIVELHQVVDKYAGFLTNVEVIGGLEMVKLCRYRIDVERGEIS